MVKKRNLSEHDCDVLTPAQAFGLSRPELDDTWIPPADDDEIYVCLRAEYNLFRHSSYDRFALKLAIEISTTSVPSSLSGGCPDLKFFSFARGFQIPHVLVVRLTTSHDGNTLAQVRSTSKWLAFRQFLESLVVDASEEAVNIINLWEMWKSNGKHFALLDLPRELRDAIYVEIMFGRGNYDAQTFQYSSRMPGHKLQGVTTVGRSPHNLNLIAKNRYHRCKGPYRRRSSSRGYNTVTKGEGGSRQIYEETSIILYKKARFRFLSAYFLGRFHDCVREDHWRTIQNVELSFNHAEFLMVFGLKFSEKQDYFPAMAVTRFLHLNLKKLTIRIPSPADLYSSAQAQLPVWSDAGGCHTTVAQWILDLLRPFITQLSNHQLEIVGFVKPAQRNRFFDSRTDQQISSPAHDAFQDFDVGYGGVSLANFDALKITEPDNSSAEARSRPHTWARYGAGRLHDPDDIFPQVQLPPICNCKHRCTTDEEDFYANVDDDDLGWDQKQQ